MWHAYALGHYDIVTEELRFDVANLIAEFTMSHQLALDKINVHELKCLTDMLCLCFLALQYSYGRIAV